MVGLASSVLFDKQNPFNPINRRISIIVMTKSAEATALSTDAPDVEVAREAIESGQANNVEAPGGPVDAVAPQPGAAARVGAAPVPTTPKELLAAEKAAGRSAIRQATTTPQRVAAAAEAATAAPEAANPAAH